MPNPVPAVLVSWVAVNNDPFERDRNRNYRLNATGVRTPGPTLTVLDEPESPWFGRIDTLVLLHRQPRPGEPDKEIEAVRELQAELGRRLPRLKLDVRPWSGASPIDHNEIFDFLRTEMADVRKRYAGRELLIHISPGTASMHTVWVLMVETGMIPAPVRLIQSRRPEDRLAGQACVDDVHLGLETYYQAWQMSQPGQVASDEQAVAWNPQLFRTSVLKSVWGEAQRFARLNVPVMVLGERGTGKTTLATWIRANSPFRRKELDKNWPVVACGQYSADTMRAELFGYEKGAFTGATARHDGLIAKAHEDTLFLDEIGDVSRELQRLLIKAVEEGRFQPLGSTETRASRFRLLSATNYPEERLAERLDADFIDRIGPLRIRLPALRTMPEEIEWLWPAVLQEARGRARVSHRQRLSAAGNNHIVMALQRHALPGNVRDLFGVAYRLLAVLGDPSGRESDAVDFAVAGLAGAQLPESAHVERADWRLVAAAWSTGASLRAVVKPGQPLSTAQLFADLQRYLANELRAVARDNRCDISDLCDVTDRSLRSWRADPRVRKKHSVIAEELCRNADKASPTGGSDRST